MTGFRTRDGGCSCRSRRPRRGGRGPPSVAVATSPSVHSPRRPRHFCLSPCLSFHPSSPQLSPHFPPDPLPPLPFPSKKCLEQINFNKNPLIPRFGATKTALNSKQRSLELQSGLERPLSRSQVPARARPKPPKSRFSVGLGWGREETGKGRGVQ